jgi:hypothetical protein
MGLKAGCYWYYQGPLTEAEIRKAIGFYRSKYPSNIVSAIYVRPADIGDIYNVDGLPVRPDKTVVESNLFIAVK